MIRQKMFNGNKNKKYQNKTQYPKQSKQNIHKELIKMDFNVYQSLES